MALTVLSGGTASAQSAAGDDATYTVVRGDSWSSIARETGISIAELQAANPQAVRTNGWLLVGETLQLPQGATQTSATDEGSYVVGPGESWNSIAAALGVSVADLKAANPDAVRDDNVLYRGIQLVIPTPDDETEPADENVAASEPTAADAEDTDLPAEETAEGVEVEAEAGADVEATDAVEPSEETADAEAADAGTADEAATQEADARVAEETYIVRPGDSWNSIARTLGVSPDALQAANPDFVRPDDVLLAGDELVVPTAAPEGEDADTTVAVALPACPAEFADFPDAVTALLGAPGASADSLDAFLSECGAQAEDGITVADWTLDGIDDLLVIYANPVADAEGQQAELMIFNGVATGDDAEDEAGGFTLMYRARAAGDVRLLAVEDINADGNVDVVWVDTTCGASTCFDTVNVRSWDGSAWSDWTEGTVTMAYANVDLDEASEEGQGDEIVVDGGVYGSVGAGPQRGRTEIWGSVAGEPYQLLEQQFSPSECLYHTVMDGNRALLNAGDEGFGAAEAFYTAAISDQALIKCWVRSDELDELRAFSYFRLALVAGYQNLPEVAADLVGALADSYPESAYASLGQFWLDAYLADEDAADACVQAQDFIQETPATWEPLADYGYTNPTFTAADVCPVLSLDEPLVADPVSANAAAEDAEASDAEASDAEAAAETESAATDGEKDAVEAAVEDAAIAAADAGDDTDAAALETEPAAALPECPGNVDRFERILPDVLAFTANDIAQVESWLASCDAVVEGEPVVTTADLNRDDIDDLIFLPTVVSDLGFGPGGSQGAVLIYHGQADGSFVLAHAPEIYGQPILLAVEDLNADTRIEAAWSVISCANFCVTEVQMVVWDGDAYVSAIEPGATIAEGRAWFEPLGSQAVGAGQALILEGGVNNLPDGGLATPHTEVWQSVDGAPFARVEWVYDRDAAGSDCLGLRLVEADIALQAADLLGYGQAIDRYTQALDPTLQACSLFGVPAEEELILLQGLTTFRLLQAQALNGDADAAQATLLALQSGQPDSDYTRAATQWLEQYVANGDPAAACALIEPIFLANEMLWKITDHYGYNHPALPAQQICFTP